jgi:hypothetical protein
MVRICPLLGNGCVFYQSSYISSPVINQESTRLENVLVICEVSRSAIIDCDEEKFLKVLINPNIQSRPVIISHETQDT